MPTDRRLRYGLTKSERVDEYKIARQTAPRISENYLPGTGAALSGGAASTGAGTVVTLFLKMPPDSTLPSTAASPCTRRTQSGRSCSGSALQRSILFFWKSACASFNCPFLAAARSAPASRRQVARSWFDLPLRQALRSCWYTALASALAYGTLLRS